MCIFHLSEWFDKTNVHCTHNINLRQLEVAQNGVDAVCGVPRNAKVDRHAVEKEV